MTNVPKTNLVAAFLERIQLPPNFGIFAELDMNYRAIRFALHLQTTDAEGPPLLREPARFCMGVKFTADPECVSSVSRSWIVSLDDYKLSNVSAFARMVYDEVMEAFRHEAQEFVRLDGVPVVEPHPGRPRPHQNPHQSPRDPVPDAATPREGEPLS